MRLVPAVFVGLVALALPAVGKEQVFVAAPNGQVSFVMPSGNIGCVYTPRGGTDVYEPRDGGPELSCDRVAPDHVNITLGPRGPAILTEEPGEAACCGAENVFAYGNTARFDGFSCSSSTAGLICETPDKRHGLCLSRTRTLHY